MWEGVVNMKRRDSLSDFEMVRKRNLEVYVGKSKVSENERMLLRTVGEIDRVCKSRKSEVHVGKS